MNSFEREIKIEKLKNNLKRQNYLKVLIIVCIGLDLTTFILHESIELAFAKFPEQYGLLIFYIAKVKEIFLIFF
jgi:hypothetical protein